MGDSPNQPSVDAALAAAIEARKADVLRAYVERSHDGIAPEALLAALIEVLRAHKPRPIASPHVAREIDALCDAVVEVLAPSSTQLRTLMKAAFAVIANENARFRDERMQLHALVEHLPSAVALIDAATTKTLLANEKGSTIFGLRPDARRRTFEGYGDFVGVRADGTRLLPDEWPAVRTLTNGDVVEGEVIEIVKADGDHGFIRVSSAPIRDDDGAVAQAVVIFDDVTDYVRAQEGIRFVADASRILAASLDVEKTLQSVAELVVPKLADWSSVDLVQPDGTVKQVALAHVDPKKLELAKELERRYPRDPQSKSGPHEVIRTGQAQIVDDIPDELLVQSARDAEHLRIVRELQLRSFVTLPLTARGKTFGALTLLSAESGRRYGPQDVALAEKIASRAALAVDNARLYDEAQRALAWRNEFISIAAHELRTPLTSLRLQVGSFKNAVASNRPLNITSERLDRMSRQVERLSDLINTVLDVSRVAEGRLQLDVAAADLGAIVNDVAARFDDPDRLRVRVDGDTKGAWDAGRIDQVVTNLVSNALKFSRDKPVDVVVDGIATDTVIVRVRDQGIGIAPGDQERIFGRFERAVAQRSFGGLGLGLWISRQIVEAHGGTIRVQSEPGQGAEFTLTMPRRAAQGAKK